MWTGIRPYQLTLLSLALNIAVGVLIVSGDWLVAGMLLILAGLSDVFDGSVARQRGEEKRSGAFMDSVWIVCPTPSCSRACSGRSPRTATS